ncbi:MAG: hypothetical protein IJ017_08460 [Oscillospiraceae bacterium]|nr:hypothetical protein [Oscillospiraceae bacterium]
MARNGPKIYKHSNAKSIILKVIAIVIAAVIILALTAFFGFRKFIAYTDTGKLYLDIPWLYGYMDGPPAEDDLAPYLEPAETPTNVAVKVEDAPDEGGQTTENDTPAENDTPQDIDSEAGGETGE